MRESIIKKGAENNMQKCRIIVVVRESKRERKRMIAELSSVNFKFYTVIVLRAHTLIRGTHF